MQLVLADNAIAHKKAQRNTVPRLRACFHVGSSYEFHQAEGLNPTLYNYIVGDVTVDLARMIERAMPGQILVGEFRADDARHERRSGTDAAMLDSVDFVDLATRNVGQLAGIELSGERVDAIRCYLTGSKLDNGEFTVRRIVINDKHGISRRVYNAKVNIYRAATPSRSCSVSRIACSSPMRRTGRRGAASCAPLTPDAPGLRGAAASRGGRARRSGVTSVVLAASSVGRRLRRRLGATPLRAGETHLVVADGDQVAVAQTMLAHAPAVDEAAVRAAEVDQQPAFAASP